MSSNLKTLSLQYTVCVAVLACDGLASGPAAPNGAESGGRLAGMRIQAASFANSEWSPPVNLGAPVNTSAGEQNATFSPDGLSLYFTSTRAGGLGLTDLWVSQRACEDCSWETPVNLGTAINSASAEAQPRLSVDGHLLFFQSDRPGGQGSVDIYVSRRDNPKDDFGWGAPVNLGTDVNTASGETGADYLQSAEDGTANLYFVRGTVLAGDFYYAAVTRDGKTRGPAVLVSELSDPITGPGHPSVRTDGREIFFQSGRVGGLGAFDLWTSTRGNVHEPWSSPVNLGAPLNTAFLDAQPTLSNDGRTLIFASNRPGGFGGNDLWISTRTPSGR